ncbi:MAG: anhydro-N-acetylmuramic acid kinase [Bacteroidota bacterium]
MQQKKSRLVVGIMSGTSLDGIDAALARIEGSGAGVSVELLGFRSASYPPALRQLLLDNSQPATSSVLAISQLNVRLAHAYADAVQQLLASNDTPLEAVDAIGCHGQTVFHVPDAADCAGMPVRSTLQLGDPSTLAVLLGKTVVGDFRMADMAAGGQGAPLVPYFDYVYFTHPTERRVLVNIGGIGNLSVLPPENAHGKVLAFDTGPGNMVIDAVVRHFWDKPYDEGGQLGRQGSINQALLKYLLDDAYYDRPPPKSTGREFYTQGYVEKLLQQAADLGVSRPEDIVATVAALTVETLAGAFENHVLSGGSVDRVIVSGGGVHNVCIMEGLQQKLAGIPVQPMQEVGLNPDAKEAVCFAVLAHETLNKVPSNVPSATGATRPVILGKVCLPS